MKRVSPQRVALIAVVLAALAACIPCTAAAAAAPRTVHFHGQEVEVPRTWPVFRLARHPGMCVRLDRRAVYLGHPSPDQNCPADVIGRRRAILIDPTADRAGASRAGTPKAAPASLARAAVFTGLGFDACTAPSSKAMQTWRANSPYRAIGVYIGGVNRACSQPNLTPGWVAAQTEAGWHLLPLYVGLQAPTSDCTSCAKLNSQEAAAQGAAAAQDAVAKAGALAMGTGSPIYFDMEAYDRSTSATNATLAFLQGWTKRLHALGYVSGVYSSSASGIEDLGNRYGTSYVLPDEIWTANWNGQKNTADPAIPAGAWTPHHRVHQYRGGHNETYGGVTINLDNNYVDAATVGSASPASEDDPIGRIELVRSPRPGEVAVRGWAYDPNSPLEALEVRVSVGGREGTEGALGYELGQASQPRPELAAKRPEAGEAHGFEASFPTLRSGRQQVCIYAADVAPGNDRLLGCRTIFIPVAAVISDLTPTGRGVRLRLTCEWPTGTLCAGQLRLRTRIKVVVHRRPVRLRSVRRSLGGRPFRLGGEASRSLLVPFDAGGRALLRERGHLQAQIVLAIPGGRRIQTVHVGG